MCTAELSLESVAPEHLGLVTHCRSTEIACVRKETSVLCCHKYFAIFFIASLLDLEEPELEPSFYSDDPEVPQQKPALVFLLG